VGKIFGVALVGGLLLVLALYLARRSDSGTVDAPGAVATPMVATSAMPPATAVAAPQAPVVPPVVPGSVAAATPSPGDGAACARLADLCSTSDQTVDATACAKQLSDARKMAGPANVDRSEQCIADAKTCAAASGCISGGVGMGAMGEFLKGLGGALSR
jgi:hypothetical protein